MEDFLNDNKYFITDILIDKIQEECEEFDGHAFYDEMLNDCNDVELPFNMDYAEAMKDNDPVMYDTGYNDFIDGLIKDGDYIEIDDVLYSVSDVENCKENLVDDFKDAIEDFIYKLEV